MLNFLNTAILAVGVAALLPLLLHLFSKRRVKVIPFSSITFLKAMQKQQVRAIKIKQLLLLIIRTLIVLAVVLAFARPATRGGYLGTHATVSAVIIVDNSASMGLSVKDGRLFDLAVKKAAGILDQMEQSDEVAVLSTVGELSRPAQDDAFGNPAGGKSVLERIAVTDGRADLSACFKNAVDLVTGRNNLNREIYVISDLQEKSFNPDEATPAYAGRTFLVDLGVDAVDNSTVLGLDFGNQLIETGTEFTATASVKRVSGPSDEETLVALYLDDKRVAQEALRLKPGETGTLAFPLTVAGPGYHAGYVSLSDDDLLADNQYYFSFYIPDQFTVLLVGEDDVATRLFSLALAPDATIRSHWSVHQVPYRSLAGVNFHQYDVVMLVDYETMPEGEIARLKDYLRRGGGVFINLGKKIDSTQYARYLADLTGLDLISPFPKQFSRSGYFLLTDFDLDHQVFSVFKGSHEGAEFSFRSYARSRMALDQADSAHVLARYSDGSPALAVSGHDRGRVMVFNCDVAPDISDISLHPFFVPFVVRSCEYLSADFSTHAETILAGSNPARILRRSFNVKNEYMLAMPGDQRRLLTGAQRGDVQTVECGPLDRSGLYAIFNEQTESDRFAVNIDPDEGDLYRTDWKELADRFPQAERLPYTADLAGFIAEKRFGRELWQYFLAAVIVLLALEMYVARDRGAPLPSEE
jgi:hypothetical protein